MIYLLHFDPPYKHARHYLGYAEDNPEPDGWIETPVDPDDPFASGTFAKARDLIDIRKAETEAYYAARAEWLKENDPARIAA